MSIPSKQMITRELQGKIEKWLFKGKILTIYGPRQVGKTTLVKTVLAKYGEKADYYDCDILSVQEAFSKAEPSLLRTLIGNKKFVVLDEAQNISNIGGMLKVWHDHLPDVQALVTGSSSFELSNHVSEPLTGRGLEFILYPFSIKELSQIYSLMDLPLQLENWLRFGMYPEVIYATQENRLALLDNLAHKYLYKDILAYEKIRKPSLVVKLLQLLALQIGGEVSLHELATQLQVNRDTVERYLDLLEKSFVIIRLKALSRNLRKEISKKEKIYFYDLGMRNSLIRQYNPIQLRNDIGALWENFCIVERFKRCQYDEKHSNKYFWRTHAQQKIDYIEEYDGKLHAYEFKWQKKAKFRPPQAFLNAYPESTINVVHKENFLDFLL